MYVDGSKIAEETVPLNPSSPSLEAFLEEMAISLQNWKVFCLLYNTFTAPKK